LRVEIKKKKKKIENRYLKLILFKVYVPSFKSNKK